MSDFVSDSSFGHQTVLLQEAVDALNIEGERKSGIYIDGTFGRGGHSREILKRLNGNGRLIAFDKDLDAVAAASRIEDARFEIIHGSFAGLDEVLHSRGIESVAGILFDLGISSPQVDDAQRGFSFLRDGPLDMRMDVSKGISAAEWLAEESLENIAEVIKKYGEERFAFQIAKAIVARREIQPVSRTRELAEIVANVVKSGKDGKNPATRTFQAIRIFINRELEELEIGLSKAFNYLAAQGRLVVISFHSLEDRIVKQFISSHSNVIQPDRRLPLRPEELPKPSAKKIGKLKPSVGERNENSRSRSAVLRICERLREDFV